jgi:hypothetical protein
MNLSRTQHLTVALAAGDDVSHRLRRLVEYRR